MGISCNQRIEFTNIQYLKVYSIPFDIQSTVNITKNSLLETTPIIIKGKKILHEIEDELNKLVREKNNGSFSSVFLVGHIHLDSGKMVEISFNNFNFKINRQTYNRSINLLKLIAPNRNINIFKPIVPASTPPADTKK